ncbi:MAG: ABC transporter ATP-binding protein [Gaiellales bacterium]
MPTHAPSIEVESLKVVRGGTVVLPDLSLEVTAGRVTGLLGPSGSGKSTLMRAVVGVQRVASGAIAVLGLPAGAAELRSRVGYVTQSPSVYADLSVRENVTYFARLTRAPKRLTSELIERVGLGALADRTVSSLSGGQRARVLLATALVGRPEVLVLDEPTVGLDPLLRRDLWEFFHELAEDGATLLVSSHVMDEAERCADLLLLRDGRLLAAETPAALLARTGATGLDAAFLRLIEAQA